MKKQVIVIMVLCLVFIAMSACGKESEKVLQDEIVEETGNESVSNDEVQEEVLKANESAESVLEETMLEDNETMDEKIVLEKEKATVQDATKINEPNNEKKDTGENAKTKVENDVNESSNIETGNNASVNNNSTVDNSSSGNNNSEVGNESDGTASAGGGNTSSGGIVFVHEHKWERISEKREDSYTYQELVQYGYFCGNCNTVFDTYSEMCPVCEAYCMNYNYVLEDRIAPATYVEYDLCRSCGSVTNNVLVQK